MNTINPKGVYYLEQYVTESHKTILKHYEYSQENYLKKITNIKGFMKLTAQILGLMGVKEAEILKYYK